MGVDTFGFDQIGNVMKNITKNLPKELDRAVARSAHVVQANVVKNIRDQKGDWPDLNEKYREQKQIRGNSPQMLISGHRGGKNPTPPSPYFTSFEVAKISDGNYAVGSDYPQARALEYGYEDNGLPARPHVEPAVEDSREFHANEIKEAVMRSKS